MAGLDEGQTEELLNRLAVDLLGPRPIEVEYRDIDNISPGWWQKWSAKRDLRARRQSRAVFFRLLLVTCLARVALALRST